MKVLLNTVLCASLFVSLSAAAANRAAEFSGRWEVTTVYPGGSYVAGLDLVSDAERYNGRSGYLVPDNVFPYKYVGAMQKDGLHLQILAADGATAIGNVLLTAAGENISGRGTIHNIAITLSGRRPLRRPTNEPTVHAFDPQVYYRTFSGANPPALRIFPSDTVRTKTLDAAGIDEKGVQRALPGNPATGPFYIEGAMVGDTIAIHFNKIRPNRDTAFQFRAGIAPSVLPPGYEQDRIANWSSIWKLDRAQGTATPDQPSDKLKNLNVKLIPMLGTVSVAPYWNQAFDSPQLGVYGGNMDYNQIQEGTTLYLPVFQAGALLTIGDGHALQADGEITGQGFETSMDVEFTVDLIRNELLNHPWAENNEYVMVSGIGASLTDALQLATGGLSNWLRAYYRLNSAEIATVLASSVHYDIAEVTDPQIHVVAKVKKDILSQLPKPEAAPNVLCMAQHGCAQN